MIHTHTAMTSSKLATVTNAKMHLHYSVVQEEEGKWGLSSVDRLPLAAR